ncbi:MAG TPA: hypothetical protein VMW10_05875 [Alphaproteobacteria bacterium]|nr:hypothetical protein [Alphaproteobacteria bacterium]
MTITSFSHCEALQEPKQSRQSFPSTKSKQSIFSLDAEEQELSDFFDRGEWVSNESSSPTSPPKGCLNARKDMRQE